jgi:hypothetical protein
LTNNANKRPGHSTEETIVTVSGLPAFLPFQVFILSKQLSVYLLCDNLPTVKLVTDNF